MSPERQVYLLDSQCLKPEVIAVAFAKTSRSPQSFREIAAELTDKKSAEFHEKWVVGYGHSSVAEHAVLHVAIENISRLAVETLESNRLASYTEKSTRYQKWSPEDFYIPTELKEHLMLPLYIQTCQKLLDTYHQALPVVRAVIASQNPRRENESDRAYENRIHSDYIDVCRFLLPAAALANVGMTINARALEHALRKMLSHPLEEVRRLGSDIKNVAMAEVPTLIKYAEEVPYLVETPRLLRQEASGPELPEDALPDWCRLIYYDPDNEDRLLASALFRFDSRSYAQNLAMVRLLPLQERLGMAHALLGSVSKFEIPLRELEHSTYTFEVVLDQGAYFEFKRHRMMTQTPQPLATHLGYAIPRAISDASLEESFCQAMALAGETYQKLADFSPEVASYVVPNAYNRRVLFTVNLRSAAHFINLRSAPKAHFSIRRVAHRIAEEIRKVTPLLGSHLREAENETWQDVDERYFSSTAFI
ncbi:MAG TPA: FAD-dependent thymidylate synthase [Anaerolineaceae bacterium]|nr:FAD-dependent thymidylate synthase [Anaerolineaceae bacterium]